MSVTIQDPKGFHWGGYLGGPVFKKVMSFVLKDQHIPPTEPAEFMYVLNEKELKARQAAEASQSKNQNQTRVQSND
jgi:cell division protein FtsI (penicillin-binding protein 3)